MPGTYSGSKGVEKCPLYEELVSEFYRRIIMGRWPTGKPLKTEAAIAKELGVSLGTVRKAFERLEAMHLIDRTPGRGTVVREMHCQRRMASLINIVDLKGLPIIGEISIRDFSTVDACEEVGKALAVPTGSAVVRIERSRSYLGRPFTSEIAYIHPSPRGVSLRAEEVWEFTRHMVFHSEIAVERKEYARVLRKDEPQEGFPLEESDGPTIEVVRTLFSFRRQPLEFCRMRLQLGSNLQYHIAG